MLAKVRSFGLRGVQGYPVLVELDLANGLPGYAVVGLPDDAVREGRERVAAAVRNSGFRFPGRRITVNLAPAQSRKEGTHFDLPIALALLCASGQLAPGEWTRRWGFIGELSLGGGLRPVPGVLAMALEAKERGFEGLVVPAGNAAEARAAGLPVLAAGSLRDVTAFWATERKEELLHSISTEPPPAAAPAGCLSEVKGQFLAKRALELSAAGGHNLLLIGPPGVGKSMLARRLPGLLPEMTDGERLEVTRVHSVARRGGAGGLVAARPFRSPHHSASHVALIGGGPTSRPGEASLAHGGVLFLDELAEFDRPSIEALRQPLEDFKVTIARARETVEYPARFLLVAATNPCPCGWRGHPKRECVCTPPAVQKYLGKLSGPLLDRIDLQVELSPVTFGEWSNAPNAETTAAVRERVLAARQRQRERFESEDFAANAYIPSRLLRRHCAPSAEALGLLESASEKMSLSARSLDRVLRVARTAADLAGRAAIVPADVLEALRFRGLERLAAGAC